MLIRASHSIPSLVGTPNQAAIALPLIWAAVNTLLASSGLSESS